MDKAEKGSKGVPRAYEGKTGQTEHKALETKSMSKYKQDKLMMQELHQ